MNSLQFLSSKDLARLCCVSVRTVEKWRYLGKGPEHITGWKGRAYYPAETALPFIRNYRNPLFEHNQEKQKEFEWWIDE